MDAFAFSVMVSPSPVVPNAARNLSVG